MADKSDILKKHGTTLRVFNMYHWQPSKAISLELDP